jgi:hypothetical protein
MALVQIGFGFQGMFGVRLVGLFVLSILPTSAFLLRMASLYKDKAYMTGPHCFAAHKTPWISVLAPWHQHENTVMKTARIGVEWA